MISENFELLKEEFKELHQHLREHEKIITSLTIVMITASVTMLSLVGIFYFRMFSEGSLNIYFSYLFLTPILIVIPLLNSLRGHRESLYKMGLYIKVFYEERFDGPAWHVRQEMYIKEKKSQSQDSVPYFAWVILFISYVFYIATLSQNTDFHSAHYFGALLLLVPILIFQHRKFSSVKGGEIEAAWRRAKDKMAVTAPEPVIQEVSQRSFEPDNSSQARIKETT